MANSCRAASAVLFLILLPMMVFGDSDICDEITCGKGTCQSKPEYIPHGYTCECDSGWRRTRLPDSDEQYLQFLPCTIPNCTINYSCMPAPPPLPSLPTSPYDVSTFNPCYWVYCGEGTCTNSSDHMHTCECQSGAYNLLNISHFPCYSDCAVGADCSKLGIKVSKASLTSGSSAASAPISLSTGLENGNHATSMILSWKLKWIIWAMMTLAVISWQ